MQDREDLIRSLVGDGDNALDSVVDTAVESVVVGDKIALIELTLNALRTEVDALEKSFAQYQERKLPTL